MRLASTPHEALAFLEQAERIRVRQRVEPVEVLVGLQMRNRYEIHDAEDRLRLVVRERGGLGRWFLRQALEWLRPFQMEIRDPDERLVLHLRRPFRFFFHRLEVRDAQGRLLGVVRRRISWIRRVYAIDDAQGTMQAELIGPLLRPWTFEIRVRGRVVGFIRKRWSGLAKELFTAADDFQLELGPSISPRLRLLCLGATFLLEFVHFETRSGVLGDVGG